MGERGREAGVAMRYRHRLGDGRIGCGLCPRPCKLQQGEHGWCRVRARRGGRLVLTTVGRSCGFRRDPVERLPLYHFLPGTPALAVGTCAVPAWRHAAHGHEV